MGSMRNKRHTEAKIARRMVMGKEEVRRERT